MSGIYITHVHIFLYYYCLTYLFLQMSRKRS